MEVYFDNSATTKPYEAVIEKVCDVMRNCYGNPSSIHGLGLNAEQKMTESRSILSKTIHCSKDEIIFTSGGSESNNFLIKGFAKKGTHIITTKIEHPSVLNTFKELEDSGVRVTYLNLDSNLRLNLDELEEAINKDTVLVSVMHINNEIGLINDIETIGNLLKEKSTRIKFHVDAVQSYGKYMLDVQKCKIDLLSASAHKIHGPKGVGFAYIRKGLAPNPLLSGGGQEKGFRSGTENLPAIAGFSTAAEIIYSNIEDNFHKVYDLKKYFIEELTKLDKVKINSTMENNFSPYVTSVSFLGIKSEVLLHALEENNIYVSAGSACSAKSSKESHVLKAIGLSKEALGSTLRFSFCADNSKEEIEYTIENLKKSLLFLRRLRK